MLSQCLVQEGEEAKVEAGESVITGRTTTETSNGSTEFAFTRENAGLVLDLKVSKIDDNGLTQWKLILKFLFRSVREVRAKAYL